jgi:MYXO-CTERM domain-containing protein
MSTKHALALTAIAAALALPVGSAQAAIIGSFDPGFPFVATGASTNNLGYRGTITFDLSAGCAGASGYIASGTGGCTITTLGATIDYYNVATYPSPIHPTSSQILLATTLSQSQIGADFIYGAYFDPVSGNVTAFDSFTSPNIYVSITDNTPGAPIHYNDGPTVVPGNTATYTDELNLYFTSGYQCESNCGYGYGGYGARASFVSAAAVGGPVGGTGTVNPQAFMVNTPRNGPTITSFPAVVTISATAVPEPESAALALIGLGALAATRRRKSAKSEQAVAASPPQS